MAFPETAKGFGYPDHPGRSLTHVPVWNLQHLRLKIIEHNWLLDSTPHSKFLSHKEGLFDSDHPDVEVVGDPEKLGLARQVLEESAEADRAAVMARMIGLASLRQKTRVELEALLRRAGEMKAGDGEGHGGAGGVG